MNKYIEDLQSYVANGKLKSGVKVFLDHLINCKRSNTEAGEEVDQLRSDLVLMSGRLNETERNYSHSIITHMDYALIKNKARMSFLRLLDTITNYPQFYAYLEDLEDEYAWSIATEQNTIAGYESYFSLYPKGKYVDETGTLISSIKEELKRKAHEEKERRKIFQTINTSKGTIESAGILDEVGGKISNSREWWIALDQRWKKALLREIGVIGTPTDLQINRILKLKIIDLANNKEIRSILPIRHMVSVRTLNISSTRITSLSGIETLINLQDLNISGTNVRDLNPVFELKQLRTLIHSDLPDQVLYHFLRKNRTCKLINK
ncbi:MAG: hypothetical protein WBA17_18045 [Saprospiraceae bacterium]